MYVFWIDGMEDKVQRWTGWMGTCKMDSLTALQTYLPIFLFFHSVFAVFFLLVVLSLIILDAWIRDFPWCDVFAFVGLLVCFVFLADSFFTGWN